jgi:hypothetical protein
MITRTMKLILAGILTIGGQGILCAETTNNYPDFLEIYQLIKSHAIGISEAELNQAAVKGLLSALSPTASLVTTQEHAIATGSGMGKTSLFDENIGYIRINQVAEGLSGELAKAYQQFHSTNKLNGLVLDLRYADGSDYQAAGETADLFITRAQPLLNWGLGSVSSRTKTNAIDLPIAILVNGGTTGSAEALAAVLRSTGVGLVLGSTTAGNAMVVKDFPLKNGAQLRVATAPITLGSGTALSAEGVKPDIDVTVNFEDERAYYADAFFVNRKTNQLPLASGSATNQVATTNGTRLRFNEAELVREHRAGIDRRTGESPRAREPEPEKPLVSDPALARALDLLKGLAVVRQTRS